MGRAVLFFDRAVNHFGCRAHFGLRRQFVRRDLAFERMTGPKNSKAICAGGKNGVGLRLPAQFPFRHHRPDGQLMFFHVIHVCNHPALFPLAYFQGATLRRIGSHSKPEMTGNAAQEVIERGRRENLPGKWSSICLKDRGVRLSKICEITCFSFLNGIAPTAGVDRLRGMAGGLSPAARGRCRCGCPRLCGCQLKSCQPRESDFCLDGRLLALKISPGFLRARRRPKPGRARRSPLPRSSGTPARCRTDGGG